MWARCDSSNRRCLSLYILQVQRNKFSFCYGNLFDSFAPSFCSAAFWQIRRLRGTVFQPFAACDLEPGDSGRNRRRCRQRRCGICYATGDCIGAVIGHRSGTGFGRDDPADARGKLHAGPRARLHLGVGFGAAVPCLHDRRRDHDGVQRPVGTGSAAWGDVGIYRGAGYPFCHSATVLGGSSGCRGSARMSRPAQVLWQVLWAGCRAFLGRPRCFI